MKSTAIISFYRTNRITGAGLPLFSVIFSENGHFVSPEEESREYSSSSTWLTLRRTASLRVTTGKLYRLLFP